MSTSYIFNDINELLLFRCNNGIFFQMKCMMAEIRFNNNTRSQCGSGRGQGPGGEGQGGEMRDICNNANNKIK